MRFLKGFSITISAQGTAQVAGFLNGILIARYLGPEDRGEYAIINNFIITILVVLLGEGIYRSTVFLTGKDSSEKNLKEISSNIFLYAFVILIILSVILLLPQYWFEIVFPDVHYEFIYFGFAIAFISTILRQFYGIYQGLQKFWQYNLLITLPIVLFLLINSSVLLITFDLNLKQIVMGFLFAQLITLSFAFVYYRREYELTLPHNFQSLFKNLHMNIRATIAYLMIFLLLKTSLYITNLILGLEQTGLFVIALGIVNIIQLLPNVIGTILFPKASGLHAKDKLKLTNKVSIYTLAMLIVITAIVFLVGQQAIVLIYSDQYFESYKPLTWLLPGIIAFGIGAIYNTSLWGSGFPWITIISPLIAVIVNIICSLWLIPLNGIVGAAQATSISFAIFALITIGYVFLKQDKFNLKIE